MTAHDQMRAMLDQLMGTGRNGENNKFQVKYSDPKVCKSFLLACCPHEILSSTGIFSIEFQVSIFMIGLINN
ncbi:putative RNA-binding protein Luc7-like 2 isoform X1 [Vespula maculifrons]|uniref:RNA-binding protein Luc7-like 2 isoform X1 n=1 Tax=Vespula maculifrons TaxID=7453 RepID=A0ABD2BJA6_VESMC